MSYEDSFEREAADARAYERFESWYVYENFHPQGIGKWEWLLMFDRTHSYPTYAEAVRDAKEMAGELGRCVNVHSLYEGCFVVRPDDYFKSREGFSWTYASKRTAFIKALVVEGRYPNLVNISNEMGHPDRYGIFRHYGDDTVKQHRQWTEAANRQPPVDTAA